MCSLEFKYHNLKKLIWKINIKQIYLYKMMDLPLVQVGAYVSVALSNDEDHPGSNVIDG